MPAESPPPDISPQLTWTEDGAPLSGRFGDVYFSKDHGLAESRAVFLAGCDLPQAWARRDQFTVAELGFGTGLNIVALMDQWRRARPGTGRLNIFSIEAFPLTRDEAARALSAWPEVSESSQALLEAWPPRTPGFHRIDLPDGVTLDLAVGDAAWALDQWKGQADAWFLDGFSPALNPEMWSDAVLDGIAAQSAPGARLATFTVAGQVRRGLAERDFTVEKHPGHGRKRERLEACLSGASCDRTRPSSALILGAGIAGASVARALTALGVPFTVLDPSERGAGASGFPSALVTPRLDVGDAAVAALHTQALERAGGLYKAVPGAVLARGVLRLEHGPRDARRFERITEQPIWPPDAIGRLTAADASQRSQEPVPGGLMMADALTVSPAATLEAWLPSVQTAEIAQLVRHGEGWRALDSDGAVVAEADIVVVTAGWGTAALQPQLGLSPVRGQASWVEGARPAAVTWGGYVAPTADGFLFGATHDRDDAGTDHRPADDQRNLETLARTLPVLARSLADRPVLGRAAVRAVTPDRLPLCGEIETGLFVLTGLGSRGFCTAPLLGEHLAALATGAPSPLPQALADRLDPLRGEMKPPPVGGV